MRVVAGEFRGRRLLAPRGLDVRPTSDRARETLGSVLAPSLPGATVLDLFAGTGAVGLELLSRGAARVVFVEHDGRALEALRANVAALGTGARCRVLAGDWLLALRRLGREGELFDLLFADPPYDSPLAAACLLSPLAGAILRPAGLMVIEHRRRTSLPDPPAGIAAARVVAAGEARFSLYVKEEQA